MTETADADLYRRVEALLEPGDIQLNGLVLHTDLTTEEESVLHERTVAVGDLIAEHATEEDTYIYSGNDDPDFGLNQHQGLTLTGDEFVWECQQLLRDGTYDVVFYYEASADQAAILEAVEAETGDRVVGIEG
ncbi:DUF5778 family protein [Salinirubellus salinus]|jgi:hypothetical protein|uniref:DUF5778 family protein n=1 Tax=Salinirubellus salinus TaxID=1364945 RepID=A0A9E7QZR8_9EURY|nr:DUF5778 family protein [Salinirubellus salinus]UWM52927.1 DUF5778 family protein [Salinirubellus salinus]